MTALGDFSAGDVLTAADMNAIGTWTDFTPTWTNLTVGNGTQTARYLLLNEIVFWQLELVWGSTTAITGSSVSIDYPVAGAGTWLNAVGGQIHFDDANGSDYFGFIYRSSGTRANVNLAYVNGVYLSPAVINSTTPFTWTTGDRIVIEDWYYAA